MAVQQRWLFTPANRVFYVTAYSNRAPLLDFQLANPSLCSLHAVIHSLQGMTEKHSCVIL